jgi:hypothetical protein
MKPFLTVAACIAWRAAAQRLYGASARRLSESPVVSSANSPFTWNYNPSLFLSADGGVAMLVRCQNRSGGAYDVGPSVLALTHLNATFSGITAPLTLGTVILGPASAADKCGTVRGHLAAHWRGQHPLNLQTAR